MASDDAPSILIKPPTQFPWVRAFGSLGGVVTLVAGPVVAPGVGVRVTIIIGCAVGGAVGWLSRWTARRIALVQQRRRFAQRPNLHTAIAKSGEGLVEIAGTLRVRAPITSTLYERSCAAFVAHRKDQRVEWRTFQRRTVDDDERFTVESGVGELEIDDGSGACAIVRAGACEVVPDFPEHEGERIVEDGARVTVRGQARWVQTAEAEASYRTAGRVLELHGTESQPLVLWCEPAPTTIVG